MDEVRGVIPFQWGRLRLRTATVAARSLCRCAAICAADVDSDAHGSAAGFPGRIQSFGTLRRRRPLGACCRIPAQRADLVLSNADACSPRRTARTARPDRWQQSEVAGGPVRRHQARTVSPPPCQRFRRGDGWISLAGEPIKRPPFLSVTEKRRAGGRGRLAPWRGCRR